MFSLTRQRMKNLHCDTGMKVGTYEMLSTDHHWFLWTLFCRTQLGIVSLSSELVKPPLPRVLGTLRLKHEMQQVWLMKSSPTSWSGWEDYKDLHEFLWYLEVKMDGDVNRGILWVAVGLFIDLCEIKIILKVLRASNPFSDSRVWQLTELPLMDELAVCKNSPAFRHNKAAVWAAWNFFGFFSTWVVLAVNVLLSVSLLSDNHYGNTTCTSFMNAPNLLCDLYQWS